MTVMRGIAVMLVLSVVFWGLFMTWCYVLWGCYPWHFIPSRIFTQHIHPSYPPLTS